MPSRFHASVLGVVCALAASSARVARANDEPPVASATVLTFTPAEHPFLMFGHTSIWIHDTRQEGKNRDLVYNFGTFDFGSPKVVPYFLLGRLPYWLSIAPLDWTLATYGDEGRGVRAQELSLSIDEVDKLERLLIGRAKPENRLYAYGYVADNCTTRVRDIIDEATDGALKRAVDREADLLPDARNTARKRVTRVLTARPFLGPLLHATYGPALDRRLSGWDATFLPDDFAGALASLPRDVHAGSSLGARRWARSDRMEQFAVRPVPSPEQIDHGPKRIILLGSLLAVIGQILGVATAQAGWDGPPRARRLLAGFLAMMGTLAGVLGTAWILLGVVSPLLRFNANVLAASPFAFALVWSARGVARSELRAVQRVRDVLFAHTLGSALVLIAELVGLTPQHDFAFPLAMFFVWGCLLLSFAPGAAYLEAGGGLAKGEADEDAGGDLGGNGSSATSGLAGVEGCGGATGSGCVPRGAGP